MKILKTRSPRSLVVGALLLSCVITPAQLLRVRQINALTAQKTVVSNNGQFAWYSHINGGLVKMNTATGVETVINAGGTYSVNGTNAAGDIVGTHVGSGGFVIRNGVYSEPLAGSTFAGIDGNGTVYGATATSNFALKADGTLRNNISVAPVTGVSENGTVATTDGATSTISIFNGTSLVQLQSLSSYAAMGVTNNGVSVVGYFTGGTVVPELGFWHGGSHRWTDTRGMYTVSTDTLHYGYFTSLAGNNTALVMNNYSANYQTVINLVQNRSDWLKIATVNSESNGWLIGTANKPSGQLVSVLMAPVPEPSALIALLIGSAFILLKRK